MPRRKYKLVEQTFWSWTRNMFSFWGVITDAATMRVLEHQRQLEIDMKDFIQISKPSLLFLCQRQSKKCNDWIFQILRNARTLIFNNFTLGSQTRENGIITIEHEWFHWIYLAPVEKFVFIFSSFLDKCLRVLSKVLAKKHVVFIKCCPSLKIPWWENVQSKQFAVSQIRVQSVAAQGCNAHYSSHCTLYCAVQGGGGSSNDWS